jgi:hypothetical protein
MSIGIDARQTLTSAAAYTIMRRSKQMALDLGRHTVTRHRGGRPEGPRPLVRHSPREDFPAKFPCHVTLKVRPGLPSLRDGAVVRAVESAFRRGNKWKLFRLVHYSLQDDQRAPDRRGP